MASVSWGTNVHICFNKNLYFRKVVVQDFHLGGGRHAGIISQKHKKDLLCVFLSPFFHWPCSSGVLSFFSSSNWPSLLSCVMTSSVSSLLCFSWITLHPLAAPMRCSLSWLRLLPSVLHGSHLDYLSSSVFTFSPSFPWQVFAGKKHLTRRIQTTGCWKVCLNYGKKVAEKLD